MRPHPNPKGEKEVAVKVVAVARAIILNSNTEILGMDPILDMDPILEILAMEPTTTTKIMAQMEDTEITTITTERKRRE